MFRPTIATSRPALIRIVLFSLTMTACWGSTGEGLWSAPDPPDGAASGLTIGFVPDGFSFVWNEGHEKATFHVFQDGDGDQVSVGRQVSPEPYSIVGDAITRDGHDLTLVESSSEIRVVEELPGDVRIEVVSQTLDAEMLLEIAESVSYDPNRDALN